MSPDMERMYVWLPSLGVLAFMLVLRFTYTDFLYKYLRKLTQFTETDYDDVLLDAFERPLYWLLLIVAVYWGLLLSPLHITGFHNMMLAVLRSAIILLVSWGGMNLFGKHNGFLGIFFNDISVGFVEIGVNICSPLLRFMVAVLCIVLVGKEFDYDVSVFFASLSLGSFAIAFAAKDALANVFGSMVLILDKPLAVGEWVLVNGIEGIVENISFRSTTIRKFSQELVYIPNNILSSTPIINYSRMDKRRLDFMFRVDYVNNPLKLEAMMTEMRSWLSGQDFSISPASVNFISFGEFAGEVKVIVYINVVEYYEWLKVRNDVNLGLLTIAGRHNVKIAIPSRRNLE